MKTLYVECKMGIAGDMFTAALSELVPQDVIAKINAAMPSGVSVSIEKVQKQGLAASYARVTVHGHEEDEHAHHGTSLCSVNEIIAGMAMPEHIKARAYEVYRLIADAESKVHGTDVEHVHFHEVGSLDAIADITAALMLIDEIKPDRIVFSPLNLGGGTVRCAHGVLPVPAPATAELAAGIPCYGGTVQGELTTTTGAALARYLADEYKENPAMRIAKTGCGAGKNDFDMPNIVRVFLSEEEIYDGELCEINCNIDDMTGEDAAFALNALMSAGALDAYYTPLTMKKGRCGLLLTVICETRDTEKTAQEIFRHTPTLGLRIKRCERMRLHRDFIKTATPYGEITIKRANGYGCEKIKPEFDDLSSAAKMHGVPIAEVKDAAITAYRAHKQPR